VSATVNTPSYGYEHRDDAQNDGHLRFIAIIIADKKAGDYLSIIPALQ